MEGAPKIAVIPTDWIPSSEPTHSVRSLDFLISSQCYQQPSADDTSNQMTTTTNGRTERLWLFCRKMQARLCERRMTDELLRTLLTAGILVTIIGMMTLAQMFSDRWFDMYSRNLMLSNDGNNLGVPVEFNTTMKSIAMAVNGTLFAVDPLFDHVFTLLPDRTAWRTWLPDALLTSFLAISLVVTLLLPTKKRIRYQSIVVARRLMWTLSLLYLFR